MIALAFQLKVYILEHIKTQMIIRHIVVIPDNSLIGLQHNLYVILFNDLGVLT